MKDKLRIFPVLRNNFTVTISSGIKLFTNRKLQEILELYFQLRPTISFHIIALHTCRKGEE